jgi:hypothetical protein
MAADSTPVDGGEPAHSSLAHQSVRDMRHVAYPSEARMEIARLFSGPPHCRHLSHRRHSRSGIHRSKDRRAGHRLRLFCSRMRIPGVHSPAACGAGDGEFAGRRRTG